jgi:putative transport protein
MFLVLALGHALGRVRIGPVRFNVVIGVLLAGVAVGQVGIEVPSALQWAFFLLFLFSIGYKTGPQFFRGLGRGALPQVGLALLLCGTSLATAYAVSRLLGFDAGMAAGLLAGALNASAAIGTAGDALARLPLDDSARQALATSVTVAFAVTYLVGLVTSIATLAKIGPWLMGVDLAAECRKFEVASGVDTPEPGVVSAYRQFAARAYAVPESLHGTTAADLERSFGSARVFVERVRTARGVMDAEPDTALRAGDVVVLSGRSEVLVDPSNPLKQHEVDDPLLLDIPTVAVDVVLTRRDFASRTLAEVGASLGSEVATRGVFVRTITRAGQELPLGPGTVVERGDALTLVGAKKHIERVAERLGSAQWPSAATDMITVGTAIALGGLIRLPALRVAGLDLGLSLPVGVLLGGLVAGWLRSIHPVFGHVPEPALWLFDSLGLTAFLALVGIGAGPGFVHGLQTSGLVLVVSAVLVCFIPNIVTLLVGHYVLRLHPGILLGICAGAGTAPAALAAVQDAANSRVPTLGYGVSYAVGNVLLALWGSVLVVLIAN